MPQRSRSIPCRRVEIIALELPGQFHRMEKEPASSGARLRSQVGVFIAIRDRSSLLEIQVVYWLKEHLPWASDQGFAVS
jgi:hypothetical protein